MADKKTKTKRKPRTYDNSSRAAKSLESQQQILSTLVDLLVDREGGEVTFDEIAAASGISVRTIFRFFKDKESLHEALEQYLIQYLSEGREQLDKMTMPEFGSYVFKLFDRHEKLVRAYLFSPFGHKARRRFRKMMNELVVRKILMESKVGSAKEHHIRAAFIATLVNAHIWNDMHKDFGFSGADVADTIQWAVHALLRKI